MWIIVPFIISLIGCIISIIVKNTPSAIAFGLGIIVTVIMAFWYSYGKGLSTDTNNLPDGEFKLYSWRKGVWEKVGLKHFFEFLSVLIPLWGVITFPVFIMFF